MMLGDKLHTKNYENTHWQIPKYHQKTFYTHVLKVNINFQSKKKLPKNYQTQWHYTYVPLKCTVFLFSVIIPPLPGGGRGYSVLPLSVCPSVLPSVQDIFRHIFLSNYRWQKSDIWSQASYWYPISWEVFLDPSDSYFLFADFVDCYAHWTYILYMPIFSRIFHSNHWLQKSDICSQALYRYPISWGAFVDPSDSYFLFAEERGYHK